MSKTRSVVLSGDYTHVDRLEDGREHPRTFRAGQHALDAAQEAGARANGLVDEAATDKANAVRAPRPARKAPAKTPAAKKTRTRK